jgi:hypothetical protein
LETTTNAFSVKISRDEPISDPKKVIKEEKAPVFDNFPADELKLWKVEIRDDRDDQLSNLTLQDQLTGRRMYSCHSRTTRVDFHFERGIGIKGETRFFVGITQ